MQNRRVVGLLVVSVLLASFFTYVFASSPSTTFTISSGQYPGAPSYTVYAVGGIYYAKGQNGATDYYGVAAADVINNAASSLTSGRDWKETILIIGNVELEGEVYLPSYTRLQVDGEISIASGSTGGIIVNDDTTNGNVEIEISGGTFDQAEAGSGHIISFTRVTNSTIHNVYFKNSAWDAIYLLECGGISITNNRFDNGGAYCIRIIDHAEFGSVFMYGGLIENNIFWYNTNNIILYASSSYIVDWVIQGNFIYGGQWAVYMLADSGYAVSDVYIWNNYIDYSGQYAIYSHGDGIITWVEIRGNRIEESRGDSIHIEKMGATWTIESNNIVDSGHLADVSYDGINVVSVSSTGSSLTDYASIKISDNIIRAKHTSSYENLRTRYGLNIQPTINNTWITNNYFEGGTAAWNQTAGTNYYHYGNVNGTIAGQVVTYSYP